MAAVVCWLGMAKLNLVAAEQFLGVLDEEHPRGVCASRRSSYGGTCKELERGSV